MISFRSIIATCSKRNSSSTKGIVLILGRKLSTCMSLQRPQSSAIIGLKNREETEKFISKLTEEQRELLCQSLNVHASCEKDFAAHIYGGIGEYNYLTKFGRPAAIPSASMPHSHQQQNRQSDGESQENQVSTSPAFDDSPPSFEAVWAVGIKNAMPFIGFGFLDNLIMILAGDYIDLTIGSTFAISTMAAAALGNTISDVAGIGSAWYVEKIAEKVGIHMPKLSPGQMTSWRIRFGINSGRAIGVVIGCILGMFPLIFLPSQKEKDEQKEKDQESKKALALAASTTTITTSTNNNS